MKNTEFPQPQAVLAELAPVTPVLYTTLEGATSLAHGYFAQRNRPVDLSHHAHIVRYEARVMLEEHGLPLEDLANNGLALTYGMYSLRILKADQGRVPCPGGSKAKQRFYQQLPLKLPESLVPITFPQHGLRNLLVIWDITSTYALADLVLALPKYGDADRASVETYWAVPIPHPAASPVHMAPRPVEEDGLEDGDLPMELREGQHRQHGQSE